MNTTSSHTPSTPKSSWAQQAPVRIEIPQHVTSAAESIGKKITNTTLLLLGWFFKKDEGGEAAYHNNGTLYVRNAELADKASSAYIKYSLIGRYLTMTIFMTLMSWSMLNAPAKTGNGLVGEMLFDKSTFPMISTGIFSFIWVLLVFTFVTAILMLRNNPGDDVVELAKKWRVVRKAMERLSVIYSIRYELFRDVGNDIKIETQIRQIQSQHGRGFETSVLEGFNRKMADFANSAVKAEANADFKTQKAFRKQMDEVYNIFEIHFKTYQFQKLKKPVDFLKAAEDEMRTELAKV